MDLIQAIVLGLIQGLTEFLPISSSGHLFLIPTVMGSNDAGAGFTAVIQLGTILAVLIYFRKDLGRILSGWFKSFGDPALRKTPDARMGWAVAVGTIPIVILGKLLEKKIDSDFRSATVVALTLIGFALLLWIAEKVAKQERNLEDATPLDGLKMGLWQCLALVPGSSRSGCTITGGLFGRFDRETAARFSFLLSVPAIVLSGLYKLIQERGHLLGSDAMPTLIATVIAFVSGYAAISFLMKYLQTRTTAVFIVYRIVLGAVILVLLFMGKIDNKPKHQEVSASSHAVHQTSERARTAS